MPVIKKKHGRGLQVGGIAKVTVGDQTLYGVVSRKRGKTVAVQVTERDPVWFGSIVHSREATVEACSGDDDTFGELARRWGVTQTEKPVRCPLCGTTNTLSRLDTKTCLSCVMKRHSPEAERMGV